MSTRNVATTAAVVVTVAAGSVAGTIAWLLVTTPATVALQFYQAFLASRALPLRGLMSNRLRHRTHNGSLIIGTTILVFGLALLLDQAGIVEGPGYGIFWALVITTVGLFELSPRRADGRRGGVWWVVIGVWCC